MPIQLQHLPEVDPMEWASHALGRLFSEEGNNTRRGLLETAKQSSAVPSEESFLAELLVAQIVLLGFASGLADSELDQAISSCRLFRLAEVAATLKGNVTEALASYSIENYAKQDIPVYSGIARTFLDRLGLGSHSNLKRAVDSEMGKWGEDWRQEADQFAQRGRPDSEEGRRITALCLEEKVGPRDEVTNPHDHRPYTISTIRYPGAGWQTAVFSRVRLLWLVRPLFRINEMENPYFALLNHFVAMVIVGETRSGSWPRGIKWDEPSESNWQEAKGNLVVKFNPVDHKSLVRLYRALRTAYSARK
jgi:hypothetical protein